MKHYSLNELEDLPTLKTAQSSDLKIETDVYRVWLSRCTVADGEPYNNKVTVETLYKGRWELTETYQAK